MEKSYNAYWFNEETFKRPMANELYNLTRFPNLILDTII